MGGSGGSGGTGGSGASGGSGGTGGTVGTEVVADIQADPDLVGFSTKLDGSESSASGDGSLEYAWEILSAPDGSSITTESLSSSSAAEVTFNPDFGGDYEVELTVSSDGESDTTTLTVNVPTIEVGYLEVQGDADSYTRVGSMVRSDGTGARRVGCFFQQTASSEASWISAFRDEGQFSFRASYPSAIRTPTKLGYAYTDEGTDEGFLQIAGPDNDCSDNPPVTTPGYAAFSFSPDGNRIAFFKPNGDGTRALQTVGADGTDLRTIRADAYDPGLLASPFWLDNNTLAWPDYDDSGDWTMIYQAEDVDGAFTNDVLTDLLMDCETATQPIEGISQIAVRGDVMWLGEVENIGAFQYTYHLWRMEKDGGVFSCERNADSNDLLVANVPHDFALSPDGTRLMYFSESLPGSGEYETTIIAEGASDGSTGFKALVKPNGGTNWGAQWVAGGRQVVWTRTVFDSASRPVESGVWIINADGKNERLLHKVTSTSAEARMVHTGGHGCSVSSEGTRSLGWVLVSMMGFVAFGYRRRRGLHSRSRTE